MQLLSIDTLWVIGLIVVVVLILNLASERFGKHIVKIDRLAITDETERLRVEYKQRVEDVRKACDERIAALRAEYERRINDLESQVNILIELLRQSNMAPQFAEIERKRELSETTPHKVLAIWPQSNLDVIGERDAIYNAGFEYMALVGEKVRRSSILRELRTGKITILEIGAHGDNNGIIVDDISLSAGWWSSAVKGKNLQVAMLLACHSDFSIADAIKNAGVPHVIAINGEIDDDVAVEFAQQFYQLYAGGMSVADAVRESRLAIDYTDAEKIVLR